MKVIQCSTVQGGGVSVAFHRGSPSLSLGNGCTRAALTSVFNNSRIMIPLEQMAAHSPSAADGKVANDRKTEYNSFVAEQLNLMKKTTCEQFS